MTADLDVYDPTLPLATLDEDSGDPPESRAVSVAGVRQCITEIREAESTRSKRRAKVEWVIDGNHPVPPAEMERLNRRGDANINWRTAEGTVDAAKTPYYDLTFESERYVCIETDYGDDPQYWYEWSNVISDGFHRMLDDWDGFDIQSQLLDWQMCVHGVGLAMFEDTLDWRWKSKTMRDFLVRDDADADIDLLEEAAVPRALMPVQLYQLIKNEKVGSSNWNVEMARAAIINAGPADYTKAFGNNWERWQDSIRTGDVAWNNKSHRIMVVDYLNKEFRGQITHCIVLDDTNTSALAKNRKNKVKDDFLYKKIDRFDDFCQVAIPFFFDVVKSGLWHETKGLGPKIRDFCEVENRLTNKTVDQAMMGLAVVPKGGDDKTAMETISVGGVTFFKPGTEFVKTDLAGNLQGPILVKRDLQGMLSQNIGQYRQPPSEVLDAPTLGQDQMKAQERAMLNRGAINRYLRSRDRLYREMYRRAVSGNLSKSDPGGKAAFEMRDWCMRNGVPKEAMAFENICKIKAARAIGYGSPQMREITSQKILTIMPGIMGERERNNAWRMVVAPWVGQTNVDALFPRYGKSAGQVSDESFAVLENNALRMPNGQVQITSDQNPMIHSDIHTADVVGHISQVDQGQGNPMELFAHLTNAIPHIQQHLGMMMGDKTRGDAPEQKMAFIGKLINVRNQLAQQIKEAQQAQQEAQPQVDPAAVAEIIKAHGELQLKAQKQQFDMGLKKEKQDFNFALQDRKTAHNISLKTATAVADQRTKRLTAAAA